jgi:hypothetical protein
MFLRLYEAKVLFFRKHYGQRAAQAYKLVLLAASLTRLLLSPFAWLHSAAHRRRHLALAGHYHRLMGALAHF